VPLLTAGATQALNVSAAVGAFLAGIAIASRAEPDLGPLAAVTVLPLVVTGPGSDRRPSTRQAANRPAVERP
jgi:hypothetical protein